MAYRINMALFWLGVLILADQFAMNGIGLDAVAGEVDRWRTFLQYEVAASSRSGRS